MFHPYTINKEQTDKNTLVLEGATRIAITDRGDHLTCEIYTASESPVAISRSSVPGPKRVVEAGLDPSLLAECSGMEVFCGWSVDMLRQAGGNLSVISPAGTFAVLFLDSEDTVDMTFWFQGAAEEVGPLSLKKDILKTIGVSHFFAAA